MYEYSVIVDLEATCWEAGLIPTHEMEMIEIGAVVVRQSDGEEISEFQSFVRPVRHPQLSVFCTELTSITQLEVNEAPLFAEAISQMSVWLASLGGSYDFCSWGAYDKDQFLQDCAYHKVAYPFLGPHRNLKLEFSAKKGTKQRFGVRGALWMCGLKFEGKPHRGIDDARNIAKIYREILAM